MQGSKRVPGKLKKGARAGRRMNLVSLKPLNLISGSQRNASAGYAGGDE